MSRAGNKSRGTSKRKGEHRSDHSAGGLAAAQERHHHLHKPTGSELGTGPIGPFTPMSPAMVTRLFWRAGFGPTTDDLSTWTGRTVTDAVDWMLGTPAAYSGVPGTDAGAPLDPTGNDTDLVLNWVDQMVRSINPFIERLTFFWHRHWANSRESVSPPQLLMTQTELFRSYADFSTNPSATFKDLANAVTVDPSMLRYLTGESNVKGAPNENYARELMELFTLGVLNADGQPNYSQDDVENLARALAGWQINDANPDAVVSYFSQSRAYFGLIEVFGQIHNLGGQATNASEVIDLVTAHPAHPAFIINAIWSEFILDPPDSATLSKLAATYTKNNFELMPLLKQILTDPALFESVDEPNMVKPPVVYVVGAMRALGVGVTDSTANDYLDDMGELPYFPPNVSGWEGGLSWLNTDTALARFAFISQLLSKMQIADVLGETAAAAYERAYVATGSPWLAPATVAAIQSFAAAVPFSTAEKRIQRQIALRALILAGPDAQVM